MDKVFIFLFCSPHRKRGQVVFQCFNFCILSFSFVVYILVFILFMSDILNSSTDSIYFSLSSSSEGPLSPNSSSSDMPDLGNRLHTTFSPVPKNFNVVILMRKVSMHIIQIYWHPSLPGISMQSVSQNPIFGQRFLQPYIPSLVIVLLDGTGLILLVVVSQYIYVLIQTVRLCQNQIPEVPLNIYFQKYLFATLNFFYVYIIVHPAMLIIFLHFKQLLNRLGLNMSK